MGAEPRKPEIDLDLPCITEGLEGVGGRIRSRPGHFIVEEVPLYEPSGHGTHLYVNLTKEAMTTREVQLGIAELFALQPTAVGYAGLKDKHARTTQTFSINLGKMNMEPMGAVVSRIEENLQVKVNWAKPHTRKLRVGHLLGNRFKVTITEIRMAKEEALDRAGKIASKINEVGVPNYYGPQRIGIHGENAMRGLGVLRGKLRVGEKWLRRLYVSSYLSHLCNRYLVERVGSGLFRRIMRGDVAKRYDTGGLFQVEDVSREQARYEAKEISFTAPIFGSRMWRAKHKAAELEDEVFSESGIKLETLREFKVRGTRRLGRLIPEVEVGPCPGGIVLGFELPKGAFATTLVREFMKPDKIEARKCCVV